MFIDCHIDLTARQDGDACLRMELTQDFVDHALKYQDGREYPLLKGNVRPNQVAQDIFGLLVRTALRREVAGDIENEMHRV